MHKVYRMPDQTKSQVERGARPKVKFLAKDLLASDKCWDEDSQFSLKV